MKKITINLLLVLMLLPVSIYGQEKGPNMSFEKTTHDFGTIKEEDGNVIHKFKFVNTGSVPVIIKKVHASCGCTSPGWSKQPIVPGATGYISATYNPKNRPGKFNKSITVISNANEGLIRLHIKGDVIPKAREIKDIYPKKIGSIRAKTNHMAFGKVYHDQKQNKNLEIVNVSDHDVKLVFKGLPDHIHLKSLPAVLKPKEKGLIEGTFDATKINDWGFVISRIKMEDQNSQGPERLTISASIYENFSDMTEEERENAPKVVFENKDFNFGTIPQNTSIERKFNFKNTGKSDLIIRKVKASCGCTVVKPEKKLIKPGESSSMKAIFKSGRRKGRQNKVITVITNDPNQAVIRLHLRGTVSNS